jgi:DNA-directed RNA polymerase subunit RPC12/RpoP
VFNFTRSVLIYHNIEGSSIEKAIKMGIIQKIKKNLRSTSLDPRLLICVECGSDQIVIKGNNFSCKNCGIKRHFKKPSHKSVFFKNGDLVRIIEARKPSDTVYKIRKMKKSQDGNTLYLLKSDNSDITLLYHESLNSHLERAN